MAYYPVTGSRIYVQSAIASPTTITAMSNLNPPVATSVGHGYVDNDEILIENGWEDTNYSVFRVDQLSVDTYSLVGFDATNTDWYPAGSGTGTGKKITTWLQIGQVLSVQSSGGGARNIQVNPIDKRNPVNIAVGFEASSLSLTIGWDPALAAQVEMLAVSRALGKRAIKFVLPGGSYAYTYGTLVLSNVPSFDTNSVMQLTASMSVDGLFTKF